MTTTPSAAGATRPRRPDRTGRSAILGMIDQGVYSAGNVVLVLTLAARTDPVDFGVFALAMTIYETLLLTGRGLMIQPLGLLSDQERDRAVRNGAMALSLLVGLVIAAFAALFVMVTDQSVPTFAWLVIAGFPLLTGQELARSLAFAARRSATTLTLDTIWTVTQLAIFAAAWSFGALDATMAAGGWLLGCAASLAAGVLILSTVPDPRSIGGFVDIARPYSAGLTKDNVLSALQTQSLAWLVAALAGVVALGQLRLLRALFGPAMVSTAGLRLALTPIARRHLRSGRIPAYLKTVGVVGAAAALLTIGTVALLVAIDPEQLLSLAGKNGDAEIGRLYLPFALRHLATITTVVGAVAISATGQTRRLALPRLVVAVASVVAAWIGLKTGDLGTALVWVAGATLLAAPWWHRGWRQAMTDAGRPEPLSAT